MAEKVARVKVKKEKGYLYFIDGNGNVARAPMARAGKKAKGKREVVARTVVKKEDGYLYFLDQHGDVSRAKMAVAKSEEEEETDQIFAEYETGQQQNPELSSNTLYRPWLVVDGNTQKELSLIDSHFTWHDDRMPFDVFLQKMGESKKVINLDLHTYALRKDFLDFIKDLKLRVSNGEIKILINREGISRSAWLALFGKNVEIAPDVIRYSTGRPNAGFLPTGHAKLMIWHLSGGNNICIVGSSNLTYSGINRNFEVNRLIVEREEGVLTNLFGEAWESASEWPVQEKDLREPEFPDEDESKLTLLAHQEEALKKTRKAFDETRKERKGRFGLVVMPPACGKTLVAVELVIQARKMGCRTLWLSHRNELLEQALNSYSKQAKESIKDDDIPVSSFRSPRKWSERLYRNDESADRLSESDLAFCTEAFVYNLLKDHRIRPFDLIIVDEAHRYGGKNTKRYDNILRRLSNNAFVLGLTATPYRTDLSNNDYYRIWGDKSNWTYYLSYNEARDIRGDNNRSLLAKFSRIESVDTSISIGIKARNARDARFKAESAVYGLENDVKYNNKIVKVYEKDKEGWGKSLVFAVTIEHADMLEDKFNETGIKARAYHSDLEKYDRREVLQSFRDGEIDVLIGVLAMSEGVDVPDIETVFMTRPTFSCGLYIQMLGRGMRGPLVGGNYTCKVVDFYTDFTYKDAVIKPIKYQEALEALKTGSLPERFEDWYHIHEEISGEPDNEQDRWLNLGIIQSDLVSKIKEADNSNDWLCHTPGKEKEYLKTWGNMMKLCPYRHPDGIFRLSHNKCSYKSSRPEPGTKYAVYLVEHHNLIEAYVVNKTGKMEKIIKKSFADLSRQMDIPFGAASAARIIRDERPDIFRGEQGKMHK